MKKSNCQDHSIHTLKIS